MLHSVRFHFKLHRRTGRHRQTPAITGGTLAVTGGSLAVTGGSLVSWQVSPYTGSLTNVNESTGESWICVSGWDSVLNSGSC